MATAIHRFLAEHRHDPDALDACDDDPSRLAWVVVTPRFHTSSHVVFLLVSRASGGLELVAKVARLPGEAPSLDREARNLRMLAAARPEANGSVPRVVAYGSRGGSRLLLESPVQGTVMGAAHVRARPDQCVRSVVRWLIDLQRSTVDRNAAPGETYHALVRRPLRSFDARSLGSAAPQDLVDRTLALTAPLAGEALPWVFAHGDLSAPNILVTDSGEVGVVDWELADPHGLVGEDLFFFLLYAACARRHATTAAERSAAFDDAFIGPDAWARPFIRQYAQGVGIRPEVLPLLFVAGLARYVARQPERLGLDDEARALPDTRFVDLWQHAVAHAEQRRLLGMTERA